MNVRAATPQDAAGIVALHKGTNPYKDWYRDPSQRLGRVPYEDLTPFERWMHGGSWMDLSLFRRHFHECQVRGFPVFVAEEEGRVVGECEVWVDEEPEPFGRYAEVEIVEAGSRPDVEHELVQRAARKVRKMGYPAVDISPQHSGGETAAKELGFEPLWDTRAFTAETAKVENPDIEFQTRFLAGGFRDLESLLALNHREPARLRYEVVTARWPSAEFAGVRDATKLVEMSVQARGLRFAVVAVRRDWLDPGAAELDLWMEAKDVKKEDRVRRAASIGTEVSRRLGAKRVTAYAPPAAADALNGVGFSGGDTPDPWLRWTF
ncbi:MAG TPA: hypothetical protein VJ400_05965 [Thermoplasmata archaeon]|nr:hypothetical protein [Thermoplasmata archaeon]